MKGFNLFTEIAYLEFVFHRSGDIGFKLYCQNDADILLKIPVVAGTSCGIIRSC